MILVFGGAGQVGQELQYQAQHTGVALTAVTRQECDITDPTSVTAALRRIKPTVVVNAAAYTAVDKAETDEAAAMLINRDGTRNIGRACAEAGTPIIHLSTDYVFDGTKDGPYVEDDPICPIGAYGRSKAAGEVALRETCPNHVILRTAWVYGTFGHNFLKTMLRLAREREVLTIVADQQGCPTGTPSLARAILAVANRIAQTGADEERNLWGIYHLVGEGMTTWHGFCREIMSAQAPLTGRHPEVRPIATADFPTPARRPANSVLDTAKFRKVFGVQCRPWEEETRDIVAELLAGESRA